MAKINNIPSAFTLIDSDSDNFPYDDNTIPGLVVKDTDSKVVIPIGQYRRNTADQWEILRLAKTETLQDEVSATGDGIDFNVEGYGTATLYISGSFVATVTFKASIDGINFEDYPAMNKSTGEIATTATTTGFYEINCRGLKEIRASVTWTSGTSITIVGYAEIFSSSNIECINSLKTDGIPLTDNYLGYSTGEKPIITSYIPGRTISFWELDTDCIYVYDGTIPYNETGWVMV